MNGIYLIPANAKKSLLIFGLFNTFDLILFGSGVLVTLLMILIMPVGDIVWSIIAILPASICGLLVFPIPNYHNTLGGIRSIITYFKERRNFIWKGWCFSENAEESKE